MAKSNTRYNFVTLLPDSNNFDLIKDIGQIPYTLKVHNNLNTALASSGIDPNGPNKDILSHLPIIKLVKFSPSITGLLFVLKYAKNVDCINFYYGGRHSYYLTRLYKLLNHNGKVYIKLDMSYDGCRQYKSIPKKNKIFKKALSVADLASVESEEILTLVKDITDYPVTIIPNGYIKIDETSMGNIKRENKFITVGRLGTPEKATNILLEAFAKSANNHDWILELVGPIDDSFKPEIQKFYDKYPNLQNRIVFTGAIYDKAMLYKEYRSARVFVLPSMWEGSPLVCPEALFNGCRMILSDMVPPKKLFTNNLEFGSIVKTGSVDSLCQAMISESKRTYSDSEIQDIRKYAIENLAWDHICNKLISLINI